MTQLRRSRSTQQLHLAAALDGAGWHPAAWREPTARPDKLFQPGYWADLVAEAEHGLLDFVTIEDGLGLQSSRFDGPDGRTDQVRGRLDAVLLAARIAPLTSHIGLVPTGTVTHTEPFHLSTALATLDYVSLGRAGWRPQVSGRRFEAAHFGRRQIPGFSWENRDTPEAASLLAELFDEAADVVEAVRRLWDSWEDDAVIRDIATGRFIDRDKLHYIDFEGEHFSVKGPSIVPRPPQGQLPVTALGHDRVPYEFAARSSDIVYITPHDLAQAHAIVAQVRAAEAAVERNGDPLRLYADVVVLVDDDEGAAAARKTRLDDLDGAPLISDALVFTGTPGQLADLLLSWQAAGIEGFRLRPGTLPHDLTGITTGLVPVLQAAGAFRTSYEAATLRGLLGLPAPTNRYATLSA
jgi:alkanesulfonate monooxygenase SsuD/methylene tetrahydromethanopterin reductase-like flavin-dependent oxidoreductase (luciferase family)